MKFPAALATILTAQLVPLAVARPDQSPELPEAVIDLRTSQGVAAVQGRWRYTDAHVTDAENRAPGADNRASGDPERTHDIHPRLGTPDFESAPWQDVTPESLESRRTNGKLAFGWYRLDITIPAQFGSFSTPGAAVFLELVVDDYAEVWVDGKLPQVLGQSGGQLVRGWNTPTRIQLTPAPTPGQAIQIVVFGANGPLSAPPSNFVWIRSATLDFYKQGKTGPQPVSLKIDRRDPALDDIIPPGTIAEKLADGFVFTEGPVWVPEVADARYGGGGAGGYLLFSDPNKNVIHRWDPRDGVSIYRTKSGYSGVGGYDMGAYHQPGSNGLALDQQGRLTICEHGNRRVTRLEPNGTLTVLADSYDGRRLNSPNDLVYRSDGALYFTDPPFGLPKVFDDPAKEQPFSGVYSLYNGVLRLAAKDLAAPNGLAFSPDEQHLYVDNWEQSRKVVLRYDVATDGSLTNPVTFFDMTATPGEICLDGLKVDRRGNLFVSGPGGIWIISRQGTHLGTLVLPELAANFAFGSSDDRVLYVTARTGLYRLWLNTEGPHP